MAKYSHLLTPAGMAVIFLFLLWDRNQLRNEIAGLRQAWQNAEMRVASLPPSGGTAGHDQTFGMNAGVKSVPEGAGERDAGPVSSDRLLKIMAESMAEGKSLMEDVSGKGVRPNFLVAALHGIEPAQAELCARALTQAREEVHALRTEKKVRGESSGQRQVFREVVAWDPVGVAGIRSRLEAALRQSVGEARMDLFQTALSGSWPQHESEFKEWVFEIKPDGKIVETTSLGWDESGERAALEVRTHAASEDVPAMLLELQRATE